MNRWRQRLAELQGNDPPRPECSSASLHNVQTVQNVQNPLRVPVFEHFERIVQRTEAAARHAGGEASFAPSLTRDIRDEWGDRAGQLLSRPCPDGVRVERWARACRGAQRFAQQWADQATRLGWTFDELFCLEEPFANYSHQGVAWFIGDATVVAVSEATITLRTLSGATQRIYRRTAR